MTARAAPLVALVLGLAACGGSAAAPGHAGGDRTAAATADLPFPVDLTAEQVRGRRLYRDVCASCHGLDGRGDSVATSSVVEQVPNLSAKTYGKLDAAELATRFHAAHGTTGTQPMVSPEGVGAVLSYLPVLAYPPDAPGSAVEGRRIYGRYCISCHGTDGGGDGPAAPLLDKMPADFQVDTLVAARDFAALARLTRDGPGHAHVSSMPAWGLFFNTQMLRDVASYLPTFRKLAKTTPSSSRSRPR